MSDKSDETRRELFGGPRPASPAEAEVTRVSMHAWGEWNSPDGTVVNRGGFELEWAIKGIGFGVFTFIRQKDGTYSCDNEAMGREWVRVVLNKFLDQCELRDQ